ncbi:hypothetical protein C483_12323 [Natrialba hulunbeirensis JCM 10989]|uniref:Uncharacterized protein n=1 Tax=Natrialba hulunbeirensis JCM 10989 TaxID=1227493 RepID=L9ZUX6_9EURY|nr:hypothetical protein C483_12323 [Natrialba hulunbeirensis JCM 10989]
MEDIKLRGDIDYSFFLRFCIDVKCYEMTFSGAIFGIICFVEESFLQILLLSIITVSENLCSSHADRTSDSDRRRMRSWNKSDSSERQAKECLWNIRRRRFVNCTRHLSELFFVVDISDIRISRDNEIQDVILNVLFSKLIHKRPARDEPDCLI